MCHWDSIYTVWCNAICRGRFHTHVMHVAIYQFVLQPCAHYTLIHHACFLRHNGVIKWKHFSRYWSFVRAYTGQLRGALVFSFDLQLNKSLSKQSDASDLRRYRAHYDVTVMGPLMMIAYPPICRLLTTNTTGCELCAHFLGYIVYFEER